MLWTRSALDASSYLEPGHFASVQAVQSWRFGSSASRTARLLFATDAITIVAAVTTRPTPPAWTLKEKQPLPTTETTTETTEAAHRGPSTERLSAFSDGVLAIAITLLILEVKVPESAHGQLWQDLGRLWPSYAAYAVSFLTIGVMWVQHHHVTHVVRRIDHGFTYRNLAVLGAISFVPFPTAVLAAHLRDGGENAAAAASLYGVSMVLISFTFTALWHHLYKHPELLEDARSRPYVKRQVRNSLIASVVYVVMVGVAFISSWVALAVFAVLAIGYAFNNDRS